MRCQSRLAAARAPRCINPSLSVCAPLDSTQRSGLAEPAWTCIRGHVYVVYEDTNLYNDMGMT